MRQIDKLVVVGVGLIGGSLAAGLRRRGLVRCVVGVGRNADNLALAKGAGLIDDISTDPEAAVAAAEMVVIATPVETALVLLPGLVAAATAETVFTDVGSVKAPICALAQELDIEARFVGAHPLAGGTSSGAAAADPSLFEEGTVLLCPSGDWQQSAYDRVAAMWKALGARPVETTPGEHDRQVAVTSHLPQVLSSALALTLERTNDVDVSLAGRALDDMTRVAASETEMWRQICRANKDEIIVALNRFATALDELRGAVTDGDDEQLGRMFDQARRLSETIGRR